VAWLVGIGIFFILLFLFPRPVIGITVLLALGIGAYLFVENENSKKSAKKRASVKLEANYDIKNCDSDYPIFIKISNTSGSTVKSVSFTLAGYRQGHSSPVYESGYSDYTSDRIIENGKGWGNCWRVPKLDYGVPEGFSTQFPAQTMIWKAESIYPTFQ